MMFVKVLVVLPHVRPTATDRVSSELRLLLSDQPFFSKQ